MRFVCLHGFSGSPASFTAVRALLTPRDAVLAPPLLGHAPGDTVDRGAGGFEGEVDRIAQLLVRERFAPAHLCGYSLGARVALGLLVRHGSLFERATLIGVHPGLSTEGERTERRAADGQWIHRLEQDSMERFAETWEAQPLFQQGTAGTPDDCARTRAIRRAHRGESLALALRHLGLAEMPDYRWALPAMAMPLQLLVGEHDSKFRALAEQMLGRVPRGTLTIVPHAGHDSLTATPRAVAAALTKELP